MILLGSVELFAVMFGAVGAVIVAAVAYKIWRVERGKDD
jgi:hypothetical protein